MKINTLWVVTKPTPVSTMEDICFEVNVEGLAHQFLGGLKAKDIHGLYTTQKEAREIARWLLHVQEGKS